MPQLEREVTGPLGEEARIIQVEKAGEVSMNTYLA